MNIGIIGGTGGMGKGFAIRWCKNHNILIGSRDSERASKAAQEYKQISNTYEKTSGSISGHNNVEVAQQSDVLILSIPYENIDNICSQILPKIKDECVVISPIVPMEKTKIGFEFVPFKYRKPSSFELVKKYMKSDRLVSAFHVISEKKLLDPTMVLNYDVFVCGDDKDAINITNTLISQIKDLRPLYLGAGKLSYMAEIATPLLLNVMIRNKLKNPGFKIC
ncbi:MAG: NADPH-dependent F420 reductase [Nitrosopumilaceae archaeon]|nr:NADPH-dependent F420 reductase [Nitrosopumilaceae archaeon]